MLISLKILDADKGAKLLALSEEELKSKLNQL